ncbi:DUF397 domain-containing protein [Yinghuangia sp. ASG 101]|uniref:DUF397 domain-containing protein n=1 Tax=Yinghuangia sp. ASG 101 TaxID=2896848 RepID=UPI001E3A733F|nr:DUF397 domain-containing protein [Yinghuangia sp. ASG 101]UGQ10508.1 DUF397 domain-containing protein [Yinghuangia sp. ASG 101]
MSIEINHSVLGTLRWRKSTHSGDGTQCVEAAFLQGATLLRDSKLEASPVQVFAPESWTALLDELKSL